MGGVGYLWASRDSTTMEASGRLCWMCQLTKAHHQVEEIRFGFRSDKLKMLLEK